MKVDLRKASGRWAIAFLLLFGADGAVLAHSSVDHLEQAELAYVKGLTADAAFHYMQVLGQNPQNAEAAARGGISLTRIAYHTKALELLDRAMELGLEDHQLLSLAHYHRGRSRFALGRFADAERDLARVDRKSEQAADAALFLGLAQSLQGKDNEAVENYTFVLKRNPRHFQARLNRAVAYQFLDQPKKALSDLQRAAKARPKDPFVHSNMSAVYRKLGRGADAEREAGQAVRLLAARKRGPRGDGAGEAAQLLVNQALLLRSRGKPGLALKALEQAAVVDPAADAPAQLVGLIHFEHKRYEAAIRAVTPLAETGGEAGNLALVLRAKAQLNLRNYAQAVADLEQVAGRAPSHPEAHRLLGDAYYNQGRLRMALESYDRHMEAVPADRAIRLRRGNVAYFLGEWDKAVADYDRILVSEAPSGRLFQRRGEAHFQMKRFDQARQDFAEAVQRIADDPLLFVRKGEAEQLSGFGEAAAASYSEALKLRPDMGEILVRRGRFHHAAGRFEEALADFSRAEELGDVQADVPALIGEIHAKAERYPEAMEAYTRSLALDPNQPELLLNRGILLERLGDKDKACTDWQTACRLGEERACDYLKKGC